MNKIVLISLLLFLAGQAGANSYFKVVDVSPIKVSSGSETNFTVIIRSAGGTGAFAEPIFNFNTTKGLSAEAPGGSRYIVATGSRLYNCTMRAKDIAPGNYSFRIGVYAQDAPYNWRTAFVIVEAPKTTINASVNKSVMPQTNETGSKANKSGPAKTPGPSALFAIAAVIVASRRIRN